MSLSTTILNFLARFLKLKQSYQPQASPIAPRILLIRRNRLGDMIYTLPLLHSLRRHHGNAHITVACDAPGEPIARACPAVSEVIVFKSGWNPWQAVLAHAAQLQNYDWVIAAKGGFDLRLAVLTRLTNAAVRIGFQKNADQPSAYYTDPVSLPEDPQDEHQIETLLRLLQPLGMVKQTNLSIDLRLRLPESSQQFATETLAQPPYTQYSRFMLMNISSTVRLKFREQDFIDLMHRLLGSTDLVIALVGALNDQQKAREIAICMGSERITSVVTPSPLDLAALLEKAAFLFTPEGGAAHLAAAVGTPALVLWSEGPFKKWHSRGKRHAYVHAEPDEKVIPVDRVFEAMQPYLILKKDGVDKKWAEFLDSPPSVDFML